MLKSVWLHTEVLVLSLVLLNFDVDWEHAVGTSSFMGSEGFMPIISLLDVVDVVGSQH